MVFESGHFSELVYLNVFTLYLRSTTSILQAPM